MDRLNAGSEAFTAVDLTGAGGKTVSPGGVVLFYENTLGRDIKVMGQIDFTTLTNSAATLTTYIDQTLPGAAQSSVPVSSAGKITDTSAKQVIDIPEFMIIAGGKRQIKVHSTNASDDGSTTVVAGNAYLCEVNTDINVRAVGGNTPAVPPTNWSSMVISAAGRIFSGFTRNG